jgi:hypothetical protein
MTDLQCRPWRTMVTGSGPALLRCTAGRVTSHVHGTGARGVPHGKRDSGVVTWSPTELIRVGSSSLDWDEFQGSNPGTHRILDPQRFQSKAD